LTKQFPNPKRNGFTLVELMVASFLAVIILGAVMAGLSQHRRTFHQKNLEQELQQNVRTAMMFIQRDLRYAASGLTMGFQNLDHWLGVDPQVTNIPWIESSGTGGDGLTLAGITGEPVADLAETVYEGENILDLVLRESVVLPYVPQVGDILLLAGIEAVVVTSVESSTRVRVSREPLMQGTGVHLIYPAGTEVFQINVIHYSVEEVAGVPSLLRDDSRYTYESNEDRVIADGIERFELSRDGNNIEVLLTGRSRRTVPNLPNDTVGDSLLRYSLASSNQLRNTRPALNIQGWPSDMLLDPLDWGGGGGGEQSPNDPPEEEDPPPSDEDGSSGDSETDPDPDPEPDPDPPPSSGPGNSGNAPGRGNRPGRGTN